MPLPLFSVWEGNEKKKEQRKEMNFGIWTRPEFLCTLPARLKKGKNKDSFLRKKEGCHYLCCCYYHC